MRKMFGWTSIGLALAVGAFIGVYAGFCLALLLHLLDKSAPEPKPYPGYDVQDEVDNSTQQSYTVFDDAVARHLLKQCDL